MKKILFILGVLLSLGMFWACSSDDSDKVKDSKDSRSAYDWISETPRGWIGDLTGYLSYDNNQQLWHFVSNWPNPEDIHDYYPIELGDDFKIDGLQVTLSGNVYVDEEGPKSYIDITMIEKCTSDGNGEVKDWEKSKTAHGWMRDLRGYILYDQELRAWHFLSYWPYSVDITHDYYIIELRDDFKIDGLLVDVSGNIYYDEVEKRAYIDIKLLEKCSRDKEIMDRDGFFSMDIEECYSGRVADAKNDDDRIKEQIKALVSEGEEYIKVLITEAPTNIRLWLDPRKDKYVYFLKSELQNPDIREGDIVDFRIVRYKSLSFIQDGSDRYIKDYFCRVEICK